MIETSNSQDRRFGLLKRRICRLAGGRLAPRLETIAGLLAEMPADKWVGSGTRFASNAHVVLLIDTALPCASFDLISFRIVGRQVSEY